MTKSIKFTGSEDFRILAATDLSKAGVEEGFKKTTFANGVPVELDDAVADALIENTELFGKFEGVSAEDLALFGKEEVVDNETEPGKPTETGAEATGLEGATETGRAGIKHSTKSSSRPR